jgi:hypothetical protein
MRGCQWLSTESWGMGRVVAKPATWSAMLKASSPWKLPRTVIQSSGGPSYSTKAAGEQYVPVHKACRANVRVLHRSGDPLGRWFASNGANHRKRWCCILSMELAHFVEPGLVGLISSSVACAHRPKDRPVERADDAGNRSVSRLIGNLPRSALRARLDSDPVIVTPTLQGGGLELP